MCPFNHAYFKQMLSDMLQSLVQRPVSCRWVRGQVSMTCYMFDFARATEGGFDSLTKLAIDRAIKLWFMDEVCAGAAMVRKCFALPLATCTKIPSLHAIVDILMHTLWRICCLVAGLPLFFLLPVARNVNPVEIGDALPRFFQEQYQSGACRQT